jgi:hypothetical protein
MQKCLDSRQCINLSLSEPTVRVGRKNIFQSIAVRFIYDTPLQNPLKNNIFRKPSKFASSSRNNAYFENALKYLEMRKEMNFEGFQIYN